MANAKQHFIMGTRFIESVFQTWEISSWKAVEVKQPGSQQVGCGVQYHKGKNTNQLFSVLQNVF